MMHWYYSDGLKQQGPCSEVEIVRFITERALTGDSLVWTESLSAWVKLSESSLSSHLEKCSAPPALTVLTPPPLPIVTTPQGQEQILPPALPPLSSLSLEKVELEWYYQHNGQQGPVTENEISRLLQSGVITKSTPLWNASMADWQPLSSTKILSPSPQPTGSNQFSDTEIFQIAKKQKLILWTLLGAGVLGITVPYGLMISPIIAAIVIYQLAIALKSKIAWLYVVLSLIPVISLVVLLVINTQASKVLKGRGLKVGFMGVSSAELATLSINK